MQCPYCKKQMDATDINQEGKDVYECIGDNKVFAVPKELIDKIAGVAAKRKQMICCRLDLVTAGAIAASAAGQDDYNYEFDFYRIARDIMAALPQEVREDVSFIGRDYLGGNFCILSTDEMWEQYEDTFLCCNDITSYEFVPVPEDWRTRVAAPENVQFKDNVLQQTKKG